MGPFNNSELHDVSGENSFFGKKLKQSSMLALNTSYYTDSFSFLLRKFMKSGMSTANKVIKLHISHSSLSPQQCPFINWTANAVLISACCFFSRCCWTWSDLNACLVYSLQWRHSPVFPTTLSLFSIVFFLIVHPLVACFHMYSRA